MLDARFKAHLEVVSLSQIFLNQNIYLFRIFKNHLMLKYQRYLTILLLYFLFDYAM